MSAGNYIVPANDEIAKTIAKAAVTVTANTKSKTEGDQDPELTYTADGLVGEDKLEGALTRVAGETAGDYDITIGTLANANYNITFTGAKLTINAKPADAPDEPTEPTEKEDNGSTGVVIGVSSAVAVLVVVVVLVIIKKKRI